jgi:hypothetical protein
MKGVTIENHADPAPSSPRDEVDYRREVDEFVAQLDEAFVRHLIEVGAFSFDASDDGSELHEELQWLLRKLGLVAFERER